MGKSTNHQKLSGIRKKKKNLVPWVQANKIGQSVLVALSSGFVSIGKTCGEKHV
jgi:hypothetical protein